jgi:23S rRNA (uracil1939-C5)-methyltransferase
MLTPELNEMLVKLRCFLEELCRIEVTVKNKKKIEKKSVSEGSVYMLKADNGIDLILKTKDAPSLEHRLLIADFVNDLPNSCRFSWQVDQKQPETIVSKMPPELYIAGLVVEISEGAFLQASKEAENMMIAKVMSYIGENRGKTADLFCGLGTFTYPLAKESLDKVISADSYEPSLIGLRKALNKNQLQNVRVINRNLFKYPFDKDDLKDIKTIVIDPPRAGAHEQCREIAKLKDNEKPQKIVFVSCNPKTFVYDAEQLINAGYIFERVTLVDQFVYSKHQELIALFVFNQNHKGE